MTVIPSVLDAAREYCQRGLSVIQVCRPTPTGCSVSWHNGHADDPSRRGKIPVVKWESYQVEAAHADQVDEWWAHAEHNVGIVTGAVSQLVVLDADGDAGMQALDELRVPRDTWLQRTGREDGGLQAFFRHPGGGLMIPNRAGLRPGLDVRGDGGYVVAPPSWHRSGRNYVWINSPADAALAPLTAELLTLLTSAALPTSTNGTHGAINAGQRNDALYRLARSMAAKGMTAGAINAALQAENAARCRPPLGDHEVLAIAKHAVEQPDRADFPDQEHTLALVPLTEPELLREGLDLALAWPNGIRFSLSAIRDGRGGARGELTVVAGDQRVSWGELPLTSIAARETLRKKLERRLPGPDQETRYPWGDYLEEAAVRLAAALRDGDALVTLTGLPTSTARELLPTFLYEGESTLGYADGDTGKSLTGAAIAVAVHAGVTLPFGRKPARATAAAYLDWETSRDTIEERVGLLAAGFGIHPPPIVYKRMTRPLVDQVDVLAREFVRREIGLVVIDSMMFAVGAGDGARFDEPIIAFYNALRLFAPAAVLVLSHVTTADARGTGPMRPYGGAFAFNGPRLVWEMRRDREITDATAIAFTCQKANNLARRPDPFGFRFQPGAGVITVEPFNLEMASPVALAGGSLAYRIRLRLAADGPTTLADLAQRLEAKPESVRKALQRLRNARPKLVDLDGDLYLVVAR